MGRIHRYRCRHIRIKGGPLQILVPIQPIESNENNYFTFAEEVEHTAEEAEHTADYYN